MRLALIRTCFRGVAFEFLTASGVFSKKRVDLGTRLLIESMVLPGDGCALDVGCGYGAVGVAAAVFNPKLRVVMVDVNERAVWLARRNIEINRVQRVQVRKGCLYEPVRELTFDCVLSNPPVSAGMQTVEAIITGAHVHMTDHATFEMVLRSKVAGKRVHTILESVFGNFQILARQSGYRVFISQKS
jgi:16S rRNA G1207 methylase RsmC